MNSMDLPSWLVEDEEETPRSLPFLVFVLILAACGAFLYAIAGPPHLPSRFPSWTEILIVLQGSDVPLEAFAYLFTTAAWLLWIWIVSSLVLRALVVGAETVSRGAAWAASLRSASDRFTLPIVRKVVDGAMVAVIVVNLIGRAPAASAAPLDYPAVTIARTVPRHPDASPIVAPAARQDETGAATYTVKSGDTLWSISQRFYGTGEEFPRLVDANAGRRMPDGNVFTRAGVIQPGWVLRVPLPSRATQTHAGQTYYVVEKGDTLRGIAARFLGDENRWPSIFDLNRGTARLSDGRVLDDPDLIWPGLRLRLPETTARAHNPPAPHQPTTRVAPVPHAQPLSPPVQPTPPVAPTWTRVPEPATPVAIATPRPDPTRTAAPPPASASSPASTSEAYAAAGLAVAALGGGAWLARQRTRRRLEQSSPLVPPSRRPPRDDFAEAEFARALAYRLQSGDIEPVTAIGARLLRVLGEHDLHDVAILLAQAGSRETSLVLQAGLRDQEKLEELSGEIGAALGGKAVIRPTPDRDLLLRLNGPRLASVVGSHLDRVPESLGLIPLGRLPDGATLFANWRELGNVLVSGLPGGGVEIVLTSVACALAARFHPSELRIWTIADPRGLPPSFARLPHQVEGIVDPAEDGDVRRVLDALRAELLRRMARYDQDAIQSWRPSPDEPELVLLAGTLDDLFDDGTPLELIGTHGPTHGVRVVAGCARGDGVRDGLLPHFRTRLVLQTLDDDESILLLGTPDAAELGNAEFFARVDGRHPLRLRGFRVSNAHLDELIRLMSDLAAPSRAPLDDQEIAPTAAAADHGAGADDASPVEARIQEFAESPADVEDAASRLDSGASDVLGVASVPDPEVAVLDYPVADSGDAPSIEGPDGTSMMDALPPTHVDGHGNGVLREATQDNSANLASTPALDSTVSTGEHSRVLGSDACRPLLYIRCLGDFAVMNGEREVTPRGDEGAVYQGLELLAFLAVHPNGEVTKDKLLATFWPDAPPERAIKRMHAALVRVRPPLIQKVPGLTPDFVRAERDGTVRFDPTLVSSDAQEFLALCKKAERLPTAGAVVVLEQARALYRGDLLTGRGGRFDEWVDERADDGTTLRERFREEYDEATLRLANLHRELGHPQRAVPLYRALLKEEPALEDVARELFRCFGQRGDLTSLI